MFTTFIRKISNLNSLNSCYLIFTYNLHIISKEESVEQLRNHYLKNLVDYVRFIDRKYSGLCFIICVLYLSAVFSLLIHWTIHYIAGFAQEIIIL